MGVRENNHIGAMFGLYVCPSWSHVGSYVDPSWGYVVAILIHLGAMLGLCWPILGLCCGYVDPFWSHVGAILTHLDSDPSWSYVVAMLILGGCFRHASRVAGEVPVPRIERPRAGLAAVGPPPPTSRRGELSSPIYTISHSGVFGR